MDKKNRIDEFLLMTELVKKDRDDVLINISQNNLVSIMQRDDKDNTVGDTILHYAVLSGRAELIQSCK